MSKMYHMTLDGAYVTGITAGNYDKDRDMWAALRTEYAGMQSWRLSCETWFTVSAADIGRGRWEGVPANNVPECVRMAEILR